ncbi:ankyrin repeat domain-containing protein 31-like isoform X3 [Takifugu flavidus]|nr:ankyrin repeat domain-containing protein 31-like isoform X3 [Takifugu flavidus]XP_056888428.1 ankyrin repeat domain-containing protein 31-like isoform X3 [Takifugu flavidus]XP_056888429.1 ankyrin repeat domain-containing protein 31-like isoform X3 [Takifugu flavidus]XP_056888430.1 ankyrin repeat domain-containing protein 31-like isoform X3 [Takifugu flavidus]
MAHEKSTESESDDDSVSLLCTVSACQSSRSPEDMEVTELNSSAGKKEEKRDLEDHQVKPPESVTSPQCPNATAQLAAFHFPNNINKRNQTGETLLHKFCKRGDVAQLRLLIQAGICINAEDNAGWTPLHEACLVGNVAVVEELLKAGANVHARSLDGVTPLHDAVMSGHYEVVKLLLEYGSIVTDRNLGGLCAVEMAKESNIKELLQASALTQQNKGGTSSETYSQRGVRCDKAADVHFRESCVTEGATEPGDIQLGNKGTDIDNSHSDTLTAVLEEVERKQAEISAWLLEGLHDTDRYHTGLTHIQTVLTEVLAKQHLLKDNLIQKSRTVPKCLLKRLFKGDIVLLATRQQTLVEILQKQMDLVKAYVTMKEKLSTQPTSCPEMGQKSIDTLKPAPDIVKEPAAASVRKNTLTRRDVLPEEAISHQGSSLKPGNTSECISFRMKAGDALIQGSAGDSSRHLSELIQRGLMAPGSVLQLQFKSHWHKAHVQANGRIKDSKGRVHVAPEHWLESILGKNIPVSSAYAWDKVMFRDKPLSHYLLNTESAGHLPQTCSEDHVDVQRCQAGAPLEPTLTEASTLGLMRNIRIIHLVNDGELMPTALLERHWEKLLKMDFSECEDW